MNPGRYSNAQFTYQDSPMDSSRPGIKPLMGSYDDEFEGGSHNFSGDMNAGAQRGFSQFGGNSGFSQNFQGLQGSYSASNYDDDDNYFFSRKRQVHDPYGEHIPDLDLAEKRKRRKKKVEEEPEEEEEGEVECEVCDITFESRQVYKEHAVGEDHIKKLEQKLQCTYFKEKKGQSEVPDPELGTWSADEKMCFVCELEFDTFRDYNIHAAGTYHKLRVRQVAGEELTAMCLVDGAKKPWGKEAPGEERKKGKKGKKKLGQGEDEEHQSFMCKLCDVECTSSTNFQSHMQGSKHKKKLQKMAMTDETYQQAIAEKTGVQTGYRALLESAMEPLIGVDYIYHYKGCDDDLTFSCAICDSPLAFVNLLSHLTGWKHRRKYIKYHRPEDYESVLLETNSSKKAAITAASQIAEEIEYQQGRQKPRLRVYVPPEEASKIKENEDDRTIVEYRHKHWEEMYDGRPPPKSKEQLEADFEHWKKVSGVQLPYEKNEHLDPDEISHLRKLEGRNKQGAPNRHRGGYNGPRPYPLMRDYPPHQDYPPGRDYPPRRDYPPSRGHPPNMGYPRSRDYPPNMGYPPSRDYPPNRGFPPGRDYPPNMGYPPSRDYPPNRGFPPSRDFPPDRGFPPNRDYPPSRDYPPNKDYRMDYYRKEDPHAVDPYEKYERMLRAQRIIAEQESRSLLGDAPGEAGTGSQDSARASMDEGQGPRPLMGGRSSSLGPSLMGERPGSQDNSGPRSLMGERPMMSRDNVGPGNQERGGPRSLMGEGPMVSHDNGPGNREHGGPRSLMGEGPMMSHDSGPGNREHGGPRSLMGEGPMESRDNVGPGNREHGGPRSLMGEGPMMSHDIGPGNRERGGPRSLMGEGPMMSHDSGPGNRERGGPRALMGEGPMMSHDNVGHGNRERGGPRSLMGEGPMMSHDNARPGNRSLMGEGPMMNDNYNNYGQGMQGNDRQLMGNMVTEQMMSNMSPEERMNMMNMALDQFMNDHQQMMDNNGPRSLLGDMPSNQGHPMNMGGASQRNFESAGHSGDQGDGLYGHIMGLLQQKPRRKKVKVGQSSSGVQPLMGPVVVPKPLMN